MVLVESARCHRRPFSCMTCETRLACVLTMALCSANVDIRDNGAPTSSTETTSLVQWWDTILTRMAWWENYTVYRRQRDISTTPAFPKLTDSVEAVWWGARETSMVLWWEERPTAPSNYQLARSCFNRTIPCLTQQVTPETSSTTTTSTFFFGPPDHQTWTQLKIFGIHLTGDVQRHNPQPQTLQQLTQALR